MKRDFRMRRVATLSSVLLVLSAACSDSTSPGVTVELTADQANALIARTGQLATATPGLSFLTDSIELVLHAGTKLHQVTITVDGTNVSYFAVGLIRQF